MWNSNIKIFRSLAMARDRNLALTAPCVGNGAPHVRIE